MKLTDYLSKLRSSGKYHFTTEELLEAGLSLAPNSIPMALSKLAKKGELKMIRRGFGVILNDYREPHPSYYLDAMMEFLEVEYYISYLTSAAHWGASHQSSMSYQVVSSKLMKKITFRKGRVEFITKTGKFPILWTERIPSVGGYLNMASPELTAVDLIKSIQHGGYINNVATVLAELAEKLDGRSLKSILQNDYTSTPAIQRLGYIYDCVLDKEKIVFFLKEILHRRKVSPCLLDPTVKIEGKRNQFELNQKWAVYINNEVEVD